MYGQKTGNVLPVWFTRSGRWKYVGYLESCIAHRLKDVIRKNIGEVEDVLIQIESSNWGAAPSFFVSMKSYICPEFENFSHNSIIVLFEKRVIVKV